MGERQGGLPLKALSLKACLQDRAGEAKLNAGLQEQIRKLAHREVALEILGTEDPG